MNNFGITSDDGTCLSPLTYNLKIAIIAANNGEIFDIRDEIEDIKIHEGLHRSSIVVEIFLQDDKNIIDELKLSGNERVSLVIERNEPVLGDQQFDLTVFVSDISNYSEPKPSIKAYTLICVSEHVYTNNKKLLNVAFEGNIKKLITNIVKTNLNIPNFKTNASVKGLIKGIYPNLQPLEAIGWLLRNSFDNDTQIYFYESAKDGLILTSYGELLQQELYNNYNRHPFQQQSMQSSSLEDIFEEERQKIRKIKSSLNVSKLNASSRGSFSSILNKIDIATKKVSDPINFKYDSSMKKLNDFAPIEKEMVINLDGEDLLNNKQKQYYISYNSKAFDVTSSAGRPDNYHFPTDQSILKGRAHMNNLDTTTVQMTIPGDFNYKPGNIIQLDLLRGADISEELATGADKFDSTTSGKYIVSSSTHHFGKDGYRIITKVKKDSFIVKQLRNKKNV